MDDCRKSCTTKDTCAQHGCANVPSIEVSTIPPEVEFEDIGIGTMRSSGTYIALMLQLESPGSRADILGWTAKKMGIPLQDLVAAYNDA